MCTLTGINFITKSCTQATDALYWSSSTIDVNFWDFRSFRSTLDIVVAFSFYFTFSLHQIITAICGTHLVNHVYKLFCLIIYVLCA